MGDESSSSFDGKALSNLRVVDLKFELEKRGLSKSGSKKDLIKRLKQKLELEKLYEESSAIGETESKLQLDEATEQNEFVRQYLAQQQKIYARQKEVKRLIELKEGGEEEETDSDVCNKDQDSDTSENVSVTKNSCDSSTHAEGPEPEQAKPVPGENELSSEAMEDAVPESSTQEDINDIRKDTEDKRDTEYSQFEKEMETKSEPIIPYSLADIQLPESPKDLCIKSLPKSDRVDAEKSDDSSDKGEVDQMETNGSSEPEFVKNHIEENVRIEVPQKDCESPVVIEKMEVEEKKAEEVEPKNNSENVVELDNIETSDVDQESSKAKDPKVVQDAKTEKKRPMRMDLEEGETNSDSEDDSHTRNKPRSRSVKLVKRTRRKFSREASQESSKSESSSSEDSESSTDSSSSHEVLPEKKNSNQLTERMTDRCNDPRESSVPEQVSVVKSKEPAAGSDSQPTPTRRIKIRRSTSIVSTAESEPPKIDTPKKEPEPEVAKIPDIHRKQPETSPVVKEKKDPPKRHFKKIEMNSSPKRHFKKIEMNSSSDICKPVKNSENNSTEVRETNDDVEDKVSKKSVEAPAEGPPVKVTYRKLNMPFRKKEENKPSDKKRPWQSISTLPKATVSISTDSLKSIIPDFKIVCPPSVEDEEMPEKPVPEPEPKRAALQRNIHHFDTSDTSSGNLKERSAVDSVPHKKENAEVSAMEVDTENVPRRTVLPEKPQSKILFVRNLVRPFTLLQLKEVLKRTGTLVEEGFWIDKIKSKCFVTYENEEHAAETRQALHNCRWPASNPKILFVEFSTQEELDAHKNESETSKPASHRAAPQQSDKRFTQSSSDSSKRREKDEKENLRDHERQRQEVKYVREWDKDKLSQESPEREKDNRHTPRKRERSKSHENKDKKKDGARKPEEETPAKLLDDLFQKTKATPCIYWLPLTEEQVKQKEDERRRRRLEREKRNQEEAERQARRKPRGKESRSRSRSAARRR